MRVYEVRYYIEVKTQYTTKVEANSLEEAEEALLANDYGKPEDETDWATNGVVVFDVIDITEEL